MKKVICFLLVVVMCFALAAPAFATEIDFVPSITAKPAPEVNTNTNDDNGNVVIEVKNESGETVHSSGIENLLITPVADVMSGANTGLSAEAEATLKETFEALNAEGVKLSEVMPELIPVAEAMGMTAEDVDNMVVTALFDLTILDENLETYLEEEGNTIELTLAADIPEGYTAQVMVLVDGEWKAVENVVVNPDGTITCEFAFVGPVAILTAPIVEEEVAETEAPAEEAPATEAPAEETPATEAPATEAPASAGGFSWWWLILVVAAIGVGVGMKRKGTKENV